MSSEVISQEQTAREVLTKQEVQIKCITTVNDDGTHGVDHWVAWLPRSIHLETGSRTVTPAQGWESVWEDSERTIQVENSDKYPNYYRLSGPSQRSVITAIREILAASTAERQDATPEQMQVTFVRKITFRVRRAIEDDTSTIGSVAPLFPEDDDW